MDLQRHQRICRALQESELDGLFCTLPSNVLMVSGYWPVVGGSVAIVTRSGNAGLLVPRDEEELARAGGIADIRIVEDFQLPQVRDAVSEVLRGWRVRGGRFGSDTGPFYEPTSYVAMRFWGSSVLSLAPEISVVCASALFSQLRATLSHNEQQCVERACRIAATAFAEGKSCLAPGQRESAASTCFEAPLRTGGIGFEGVRRAGGRVSVMSGPNSGCAYGAYARSRARTLQPADLVMVHCNSFADGYWTDITRTYSLGPPDTATRRIFNAVFEARGAALGVVRPGAEAKAVDSAARKVIARHGFADQFRHATGHGVGFAAIDHDAHPQISADSADVLEAGMVFNLEPAVYVENFGGVRHCDVVVVTETGARLLTPFQSDAEDLIV